MMSKMPIFIYNSFLMGPALGDYVCRYYGFLGGLSGTCSICTLSAISLDRYYVVKFPLNRRFTNLRAKICVALSWTYAITFSMIPLLNLGLGVYTPEGFLTSCSYDYLTTEKAAKDFILVFFFAAWTVPFLLITFAYANILQVVLHSRNIAKKSASNRESIRHMKVEERKRQELRLTLIVLMVILMWFVAWTPYAAVSLLGIAGKKHLISPLTSMIPALFCKTASCFDPYVYALTHPRFKAELVMIFKGRKTRRDTVRMWTTQSRNTRRNCSEVTENEESFGSTVRVPNKGGCVEPVEVDFGRNSGKCKQSWWFKPSFSNRSSSLRGLARTWTARERSVKETNSY